MALIQRIRRYPVRDRVMDASIQAILQDATRTILMALIAARNRRGSLRVRIRAKDSVRTVVVVIMAKDEVVAARTRTLRIRGRGSSPGENLGRVE
jgi:hypothetical protein